ncbi:hypothetical protein FA13DRAFT_1847333 [Coprinellus micaceus]|uniref:Uncharacterized protein n=1 Tax=Coprinellus micaceus TaxID=71717 RepID=A0A4Y7SCA5_COPMI|nr:hypothetical protein FA13DRAFT_1847333 [Coprinellus micaceus]
MDVTEILTHAPPPSVSYPALNPHTPLSYVSAGTATQMSIGSYVVVGSLAVRLRFALRSEMNPHPRPISRSYYGTFCRTCPGGPEDSYTVSYPAPKALVYLVSRLAIDGSRCTSRTNNGMTEDCSRSHMSYGAPCFYVSAVGNCADNLLGLSVLYPLSISASTLLLLCRMRLVYRRQPSSRWPILRPLVFVHCPLAYRLTAAPCGKVSMREWVSGMFTGSYLAGVSKLIFEDSRLYYVYVPFSIAQRMPLAELEIGQRGSVVPTLSTAIMILANSISIPLRSAFFVLNGYTRQHHGLSGAPQHEAPNVPTSQLHYL